MYPGGVRAIYTFDELDRQETLDLDVPGEPLRQVVTGASYRPAGPLAELVLGNGLTETRAHDARYFPDRITVAGAATLFDWDYTVDAVGNPTAINDLVTPAESRVYAYQDVQYYLAQGNGPWGDLSWSYDRIGDRLTETRDGITDTYSYTPNPAGGNSAQLSQIQLGTGGTRTYAFDAAGNQTQATDGAEVVGLVYDAAGRLATIDNPNANLQSEMLYDGRSFLRYADEQMPARIFADAFESGGLACWSAAVAGPTGGTCPEAPSVEPTYSSEGTLYHQSKDNGFERHVLYFADRPVSLIAQPAAGGTEILYLSADHLGTPILASDPAGVSVWTGGFEPYGNDGSGAQQVGVFLRLQGQWKEETWSNSASFLGLNYNVHRWYQVESGRYSRPDPIGMTRSDREGLLAANNLYTYAAGDPLFYVDPLGLRVVVENPKVQSSYNQLKACFPLFRSIAGFFEGDKGIFGLTRTWTVKDPDFFPPSCMVGGRNSELKTIWVPPGRDCPGLMRCLFHEFYELWLIRAGGFPRSKMGAGPADRMARHMSKKSRWMSVAHVSECTGRQRAPTERCRRTLGLERRVFVGDSGKLPDHRGDRVLDLRVDLGARACLHRYFPNAARLATDLSKSNSCGASVRRRCAATRRSLRRASTIELGAALLEQKKSVIFQRDSSRRAG